MLEFPKMIHVTDPDTLEPIHQDRIRIVEALLDCDAAGSTSDEAGAALKHSMTQKLAAIEILILAGICTDAGGGGTGESFKTSLIKEGCADQHTSVSTCSLHNIQTCLDSNVLRKMWDHANALLGENEKFYAITNPVLTRWWLVGKTAFWVFPHFDYLQQGDWITHGKAGYQTRLILERYFLMASDLKLVCYFLISADSPSSGFCHP
mmetsp:Transcript_54432/g.63624  ORF Transcript_54432/g.63624 Transcript_54432/m.63624 type:complete len:207 (+) Transcript_54432:954-1574(+)